MIQRDYATAEVKQGNTLANPLFEEADALKKTSFYVWRIQVRSATLTNRNKEAENV